MNTLITKLPDSVSDETLPKIGELRFHLKSGTGTAYLAAQRYAITELGTMRIVGDGHFTDAGGTANYGKTMDYDTSVVNTPFYVIGTEFDLFIPNKYALQVFGVKVPGTAGDWEIEFTGGDFSYTSHLNQLDSYRFVGRTIELSDFAGSPLTRITGSIGSPFYGDVSVLAKQGMSIIEIYGNNDDSLHGSINAFDGVTSLTRCRINQARLTGDISKFKNNVSLSLLGVVGSTDVTGTVETLLNGLHTAGKTSGTLVLELTDTSVTYNGLVPTGNLTATFTVEGWSVA